MSSLKHILETFKHLNTNLKTFPFVFPRRAGIYGWSILQVYMYFMCFYIRCYSNPPSFFFPFYSSFFYFESLFLGGALAAGREKEGELATTSPEFEYLHRKSRYEMPIGGYDISNDVITLGTCFSMFVHIHTRFCYTLIGGNLTV